MFEFFNYSSLFLLYECFVLLVIAIAIYCTFIGPLIYFFWIRNLIEDTYGIELKAPNNFIYQFSWINLIIDVEAYLFYSYSNIRPKNVFLTPPKGSIYNKLNKVNFNANRINKIAVFFGMAHFIMTYFSISFLVLIGGLSIIFGSN